MANDPLKPDPNFKNVSGGVTDDPAQETRPLLVDPTTGRLLVDITGSTTAIETLLTTIAGYVDQLEGYVDGVEGTLTAIQGYVDTLETKLQSVIDNTDQLEGYVDGLETLGTALNGYVDQLEGYVDQLEGYLDTVETKLQSIIDNTTVAFGAGVVSATTQRMTLASDDPAVVSLQLIDNFISGSRGLVTEDNSAAIAASLSIMDDWDESDRVKVNPIVGVAGVAAGAGAVGTTTQRITLASDDPAVTSLQLIDDAVATDDASSSPKLIVGGFRFDDSAPDSVDENDFGYARMSANRNLYITIRDAAGNERGLNIDASGNIAVTQSGTWTEANSAAIAASLSVIDDWDASDRAKVDLIAGQVAITAGAGAVAANTPRVTLASDDPVTTSVQLIDDTVYTDDTSTHSTGSSKGLGIMAAATPTDAAVNANDIGMLAMTLDRRLLVDASGVAVPVTDNSSSLTVDNAGTFAVQDSAAEASLSVLDDWDESDRAKVNTIVGQAGLQGGSGTVSSNTLRMVLATDVGLPAGTSNIGDIDVVSEVSTVLDHGANRDIDTTAEQITSTSFACKFGVLLKASHLNTGTVYIGNSDVTAGTTDATDGFPLMPGESVLAKVNNTNIPYAIGSANNQIIYWFAV